MNASGCCSAQRASHKDASEQIQNEGAVAATKLLRLLAKYGLSLADIPEVQRQHEQYRTAKAAGAPAPGSDLTVLDAVYYVLTEYVDLEPHEYIGVALFVLHTHVFRQFQISPRLALLSPVRGCGKTKVLKLIARLAANPERYDNRRPNATDAANQSQDHRDDGITARSAPFKRLAQSHRRVGAERKN